MRNVGQGLRGRGRRWSARLSAYAPAVVVAGVALVARLVPVLRGGGLRGILAYDDGVYYSASDALLSGRLPYRDFLLLHPPGITVALAPFAALGRVTSDPFGMATARIAFMLVGAASAVLVWRVASRISARAGLLAGLFYAVWQPATYAERTTLLEPLVNLGLLASLALLSRGTGRRWVAAAGVALGLAVTVKAWAAVPFAVLVLWLLVRRGRRDALTYAAAGSGAALLVCLPFLAAAGPRMIRMVVLDQLGRTDNGVPVASRLARMLALPLPPVPMGERATLAVVLAAVGVAVAVALVAWRRPETRLWAALLAAAALMLLASPSYFTHYGTFMAPSLALLAGAGADGLMGRVTAWAPPLRRAFPAVTLATLAVLSVHVVTSAEGRRAPAPAVVASLQGARCVAADSAAALVAADVLTRDLRNGCPVVVDVTGLSYDQDPGDLRAGSTPRARRQDPEWQRGVARYLSGADAVVLDQWRSDGLDPTELRRLEHRDLEVGRPSYRVLVPAS